MAERDRTGELLTELINRLAGPVSAGAKLASDAATRRADAKRHMEELCAELQRARDVGRRVVDLLDEIETPLRRAAPLINQLVGVLEEVLADAPEDLGPQLRTLASRLGGLADGLGPLLMMAQGAAGMFGSRPASSGASTAASTATAPATTTTVAKKTTAKTTASKTSTAKTTASKTSTAKKSAARKSTAKKVVAKKSAAKKTAAKKTAATK
ncbi:MAG: hypothetical protein ACO3U0_04095 [Ilumatobacteraceae bacterium]